MDSMQLTGVAGLVVGVLAVVVAWLLVRAERRRRRADVATSRADVAQLREQVAALTEQLGRGEGRTASAELLITRAGEPDADDDPQRAASSQIELRPSVGSAVAPVLAEGALRAAALAHGVRQALRPEVRNRIAFEMRREVRRQRVDRRHDQKLALRRVRAERRARLDDGAAPAPPPPGEVA